MPMKSLTGFDASGSGVKNVADPSATTDAANKQYVDNRVAGFQWKANVKAATTANIDLSSALVNNASIDGITVLTGDRVLVKNQTTGSQNGIYLVSASGAASRSTDANTSALVEGMAVRVAQGSTQPDTIWQMITDGITLGTTSLVFTQFTSGQTYTGSNGVAVSGTNITGVTASGGGLTVGASGFALDTSIARRKYQTTIGDGSATSFTITHNLNNLLTDVAIFDTTNSYARVYTDESHTANTVVLTFPSAPSTGQYAIAVGG